MNDGVHKSSPRSNRYYHGEHRLRHWYRDNQVYFVTSRCRNKFPAFASNEAKSIFWDRFEHYTGEFGFTPWVTSLLDNHYHPLGYLREGRNLGLLMQKLHGSTAKLVNDLMEADTAAEAAEPHWGSMKPFWGDSKDHGYFDGCIRDEKQCRLAYRYIRTQSRRHGIVADYWDYPHTRAPIELERGMKRANELEAFLRGVPYRRYGQKRGGHGG